MISNNRSITFAFIVIVTLVILNCFMFQKVLFVCFFSIPFLILIYKFYSKSLRRLLFFSTVLFSIVDYTLVLPIGHKYNIPYFYITLSAYWLIVLFSELRKNRTGIFSAFIYNLKKNRYLRFLVIFAIYAFVGVFFAASKSLALKEIFIYSIMSFFAISVYLENRNTELTSETFSFFKYLYAAIVLMGILEVFGLRFGIRTNYLDTGVIVQNAYYFDKIPITFFYNQNNFAVFLVLGMSVLSGLYYFSKKRKEKIGIIILFILSQIDLIFTTSRICWATILIIFVLIFLLSFIKKYSFIRGNALKFFLLTISIFVIVSLIPDYKVYFGRLSATPLLQIFNIKIPGSNSNGKVITHKKIIDIGASGSDNERITIVYDIIEGVFINGRVLGYGAGNTANYLKELGNTHGMTNTHSLWFQVMGDFGLIIFTYFCYIYFITILKLFSVRKNASDKYSFSMAIGSTSFIFLAFAPSTVIAYSPFWILIGLSFTLVNRNEKE